MVRAVRHRSPAKTTNDVLVLIRDIREIAVDPR
jgi:hypothetical protein